MNKYIRYISQQLDYAAKQFKLAFLPTKFLFKRSNLTNI